MYKRQIQRDTEDYEAQPIHEMEVITINNIETQPGETPQVEPEIDMRVDNRPRRPEGLPQPGDMNFFEMMRTMMEDNQRKMEETANKNHESLKEDGRKSPAENQKNIELLNKNIESMKEDHRDLNKNIESMREDLNKKDVYKRQDVC